MTDILDLVVKEKPDTKPGRRRTIPLFGREYEWWPNAVRLRLAKLGIDQVMLADHIQAEHSAVNKCINRRVPVYELLIDISDALDLHYPVVLPESYEEAIEVAKERRLRRRDAQIVQIKAGVADPRREGQIKAISSADVARWKSSKGAQEEHRARSRKPR